MKKIALSLIALAALSGAALAERSYDLRDLETVNGQSSSGAFLPAIEGSTTDSNAAAIVGGADYSGKLTAYQRALLNAERGDNGEN